MHLCWETVEYNTLLQKAQALNSRFENLLLFLNPTAPRVSDVITSLQNMSKEITDYLRNLFVKKRQPPATHILIIMVSEERRNKKPYALPVQYVPYHTIRDQYLRDLSKSVKLEMTKLGMKTVGKYMYFKSQIRQTPSPVIKRYMYTHLKVISYNNLTYSKRWTLHVLP